LIVIVIVVLGATCW